MRKVYIHTFLYYLVFLFIAGCSQHQPKCSIESLVLDGSGFPKGTFIGKVQLEIPEMPKESAYRGFSYGSDDVINYVVNWKSVRSVEQEFDKEIEIVFDEDHYMGPWETPKDLYLSTDADNYRASCGIVDKLFQCRLLATYDTYLVYFKADVSDQWLTISKVNEFLKAIDTQMLQCTK